METSAIGANGPAFSSAEKATTRGFNDLSSEDFFQLLIAELQSQDPMNPTDNQQLLQQLSSMRQMEDSAALNKTLELLAGEQRFGAVAALIGHYVAGTVTNDAGESYELQGLVIGVRFERDGEAVLELHDGRSLPASSVEQVTLVENLPPDILEQLQEELGLNEEGEGDAGDPAAAARAIKNAARTCKPTVGDQVRTLAERTDAAASLLDTLLAPGISVGI
ncbi:MAG: flagellar hook capping FlgD N-terminal domain-containing protein [Planctomycetota bacterium]